MVDLTTPRERRRIHELEQKRHLTNEEKKELDSLRAAQHYKPTPLHDSAYRR